MDGIPRVHVNDFLANQGVELGSLADSKTWRQASREDSIPIGDVPDDSELYALSVAYHRGNYDNSPEFKVRVGEFLDRFLK